MPFIGYIKLIFLQGGSYEDIANVPFSYYPHLGTYLWGYFWSNSFLI